MRKFLVLAVFILLTVTTLKAGAFWPFEKEWENNPSRCQVLVSDNGFEFSVTSEVQSVEDFLKQQNIKIGADDYLFPKEDEKLSPGMKIIIRRALPVTIKVDGKEIKSKTFSRTVDEAIAEAGVTLSHLDKVRPDKKVSLEKNLEIAITRINEEEVTEQESIEFQTVEKDDPRLRWRKTRIDQEGENGTKDVVYKITYTNGVQTSKVKLSLIVTKKPTNKIIANGTKIEVGKVTKGRASWYAYTGTMACASLQFPQGTWLRVTNTATGKNVIVQVNDSGPYSDNKIIDLDKVAFDKIGDLGQGVMNVKVEEILE